MWSSASGVGTGVGSGVAVGAADAVGAVEGGTAEGVSDGIAEAALPVQAATTGARAATVPIFAICSRSVRREMRRSAR